MTTRKTQRTKMTIPEMLAVLIDESFADVRNNAREETTLKEFLKMAELYHKLSPKEFGGKEYWDMIEQIRRDALSGKKRPVPSGKGRTTTGKKEKAIR